MLEKVVLDMPDRFRGRREEPPLKKENLTRPIAIGLLLLTLVISYFVFNPEKCNYHYQTGIYQTHNQ